MYCVVKYGRGMPEAVMGHDGLPMTIREARLLLPHITWSYGAPAKVGRIIKRTPTLGEKQIIAETDFEGERRLVQIDLDPETPK